MPPRVLVIDDDQGECDILEAALKRIGFETESRTSGADALELLGQGEFDAVLTDLQMAEMDGFIVCERVKEIRPGVPVVVVTGQGSMEAAVRALRAGAYDFVTKPVDSALLAATMTRATQNRSMHREIERLRREIDSARPLGDIVGTSPAMRKVYELVSRVAESDATVLIHGETGTGKELVARAIHTRSHRGEGPFVAINCAAVPATLIESELFGHAKGAFTDAKGPRGGLFVEANGGTLFLDEIGEMPLEVQPKLLRALQEKKVRPLGTNQEIPFDARLITATNRDLEHDVVQRRFREDLYYRVNVVKIELPPLRDRGADVLAIASSMLERLTGGRKLELSPAAAQKLMTYDWPGNVRELENCMERAVALARSEQINVEDLPERVRTYRPNAIPTTVSDTPELITLEELERRYIRRVLTAADGNKTRAAQILGLDRRTLYRKLERLGSHETVEDPARRMHS
jgi:two-component system response regulator HydG